VWAEVWSLFLYAVDLFVHLDIHLATMAQTLGIWLYLLLFLVIFAETGLVVTPILPGDSLLFAAGALAAIDGTGLNIHLLAFILVIAAVLGDAVNYAVGRYFGPRLFVSDNARLLNKKYLVRTEEFYRRHGPFTIVIARFVPIVRTFAPFVAGVGKMNYRRFAIYNVTGALAWVLSFTYGGYVFGNLPAIKRNFHFVVLGIILVSVLPIAVEWIQQKRRQSS